MGEDVTSPFHPENQDNIRKYYEAVAERGRWWRGGRAEIERLHEELRIARWDADLPIRELREEVERLREALRWIDRVTATESEYKAVARQALDA